MMNVCDPIIVSEEFNPPRREVELVVPEDLFFLRGHFPGRPVLPGVVQIHWAVLLARPALPLRLVFRGIEVLKFHQIIKPMARLKLALEYVETTGKLKFSYLSDLGAHSQGRIVFGRQ